MSTVSAPASLAQAATFTVTTKIFDGTSVDVSAEHRVLFDNGLIYDVPSRVSDGLVTVYDSAQQRVTLIDRTRQLQTTIETEDLVRLTAQARAAAKTPEQQEKIGLKATVEPSDRVSGVSIGFADTEYHTTTQTPDDPNVAIEFGRFADLACRLNILRLLGPPPFARMTLNGHIASSGRIPLETTRTQRRGGELTQLRSTHTLGDFTDADRKAIAEVQNMLTFYRPVGPKEFPR